MSISNTLKNGNEDLSATENALKGIQAISCRQVPIVSHRIASAQGIERHCQVWTGSAG